MTHSSSLATRPYSIEPRTRKYVKEYGFLSFTINMSNKYGKQLLDIASKKVGHKAAEATGKFIGNQIVKPVEEKIIPQKKEEILNELRGALKNWNNMKYLNY